jgi:hypothetical protein
MLPLETNAMRIHRTSAVVKYPLLALAILYTSSLVLAQQSSQSPNPLRNAYFGDLHVHTSYSLDAYSFGNRNDPRSAYRYGTSPTGP